MFLPTCPNCGDACWHVVQRESVEGSEIEWPDDGGDRVAWCCDNCGCVVLREQERMNRAQRRAAARSRGW